MRRLRRAAILSVAVLLRLNAADLHALPEHFRPDPFGAVVQPDAAGAQWWSEVKLRSARGAYVSFHLVARGADQHKLTVELPLAAEVYREWFHFNDPDKHYYPDALVPVTLPHQFTIPDPDNRIPGQTAQAYWVDIWVPANAEPKVYRGSARLTTGSQSVTLPIEITVLPAVTPDEDVVTIDHNSYGTSWLQEQYPKTLAKAGSDAALFQLIHAHHRLFYEHRGIFHQLGYGHAGRVGPEFAPELSGSGRAKHISSWDRFDRHYGPLLDGSAFAGTRRGARPIPWVYLPINPEWPASFLWWGEPGYEAEFVQVVSQMEQHFRERGWTRTQFEVFFNHKKRYKGFPWDGDEVRFNKDNAYFKQYHQWLNKAVPASSPVHFTMRADASWTMEEQFTELDGIIGLWVVGEDMFSWYAAKELPRLKARGNTVWTYGGTPPVTAVSSTVTLHPLRSWITGVDGFVRWLTVAPGPDPWFHLQGAGETMVYSGERFGVAGPLASIRLKLQRNCLQDLALQAISKADAAGQFNHLPLDQWRNTKPPLAAEPVLSWTNYTIDVANQAYGQRFRQVDPNAWQRVRELILNSGRAR